jgi:homoserine kinase
MNAGRGVRIRVPASAANLGPGFDVLAMAVDLWLEVEAEPAPAPDWRFEGEGAETLNRGPNPLTVLPMRGRVLNQIPLGVGLGSSAAARLARAALQGMDVDAAYDWAALEEGHADNAAAAAYGGVRLCTHPLPVPDVDLALLVANQPCPTEEAREALPGQVPLDDAVFNCGRLALLVHALHTGAWELLGEAMTDRLHQPYRRHLYPWTVKAMEAAREAGCYGTAISGAGPSVLALCPRGRGEQVAQAMAVAAPLEGRPVVSRISPLGMSVVGI